MGLDVKVICNGVNMGVWYLVSWQCLLVFFEQFIYISK